MPFLMLLALLAFTIKIQWQFAANKKKKNGTLIFADVAD
jgi:hypothetical protein